MDIFPATRAAAFDPSGKQLALQPSSDAWFEVFDTASGHALWRDTLPSRVQTFAFDASGRRLFAGCAKGGGGATWLAQTGKDRRILESEGLALSLGPSSAPTASSSLRQERLEA
jgi:hypothetical protein